jgi:tetratricopeptide (TPR) repeat protein
MSNLAARTGPGVAAGLFVAAFGLLLASFPARNPDLWAHLAAGRALVRGSAERFGPTWLYDVVSYGLVQLAGGTGLVAVKAGVVAALAVVLLRLSRTLGGWAIPTACTALALLAVASRAPLAPVTVSYLLLAVAAREAWREEPDARVWPGWGPVGLFVVWGNTDRWFLLGLVVVALIRLGRWLDDPASGVRGLLQRLGSVVVLAAAALMNPAHLSGFPLPEELGWEFTTLGGADPSTRPVVTSPFTRTYLSSLGVNASTLAYYPLLGLGLASFLLVLPQWRWGRFLPWAALAALSALQARAVPFFAVAAGPVLAWNLQDFFARRPRPVLGPRVRVVTSSLAAVLGGAFLICAWPGWLQRPPFEPRRWAARPPAALEQAAAAVCRGHAEGAWPQGTHTLHLSRDSASAFAWLCPEDVGVVDASLAKVLAGTDDPGAGGNKRLAAARVGRVVVLAADRGSRAALTRLLADPDRWPLLHLAGGVVVFGRRGPAGGHGPDPFRGREVDLDRLAFRPDDGEKSPSSPLADRPAWWEAFWKPAAPATGDRDEAAVLLLKAELLRGEAPARHLAEWEAGQLTALLATAPGCVAPVGMADAAVRLSVLHPPVPQAGEEYAPITRYTFDCQRLFALERDDAPPGLLYAAVRAARRAVTANPDDANGYLLLGQCYVRLLTATRERVWALRLPQLAQIRQAQASAALNRALALNPGLAQAHLELGGLYRQVGILDLALTHLRAYRRAAGGAAAVSDADLAELAAVVDRQRAAFAPEAVRGRVAGRARAALERGLAGEARTLLLESDVSAFGAEGTELELNLLLRTGRAEDVRDWTGPDAEALLGPVVYHWLRTQALAAVGDYSAAEAELTELTGDDPPDPARTGRVFAALTGRALLDEQPVAFGLPALVARALARFEFRTAIQEAVTRLGERADADVVRGLLALEAGDVDRARAAFRTALSHSAATPEGGGLDFNGRPVARDGLALLR